MCYYNIYSKKWRENFMNIDWGKVGAIATIVGEILGVIVGIIGIIITIVIYKKSKKHKDSKANNQVIKGTLFRNNKIVQSNSKSKSNCDDNEQIIEGRKFLDNDIKQEK